MDRNADFLDCFAEALIRRPIAPTSLARNLGLEPLRCVQIGRRLQRACQRFLAVLRSDLDSVG